MAERGTRFERSVLTFGAAGRVAATLAVLAPLVWIVAFAGVLGILGALMWTLVVLPPALRDIWRPAALPHTDLTRLRDETRRAAARERDAASRPPTEWPEPPKRW